MVPRGDDDDDSDAVGSWEVSLELRLEDRLLLLLELRRGAMLPLP